MLGTVGEEEDDCPLPTLIRPLPRDDSYNWIRFSNDQTSRRQRLMVSRDHLEAVQRGWYTNNDSSKVHLQYVDQADATTRIVTPGSTSEAAVPRRGACTVIEHDATTTVPSLAVRLGTDGKAVAVISAASAYHVGGGFSTGGRHALEEALCMQSTLYKCLKSAWRQAGVSKGSPYIPKDGAILSPDVEIFRDSTSTGYDPLSQPVRLSCVASIAMPNLNPKVRDAPLESMPPKLYQQTLSERWRAALLACSLSGAGHVVVPEAGCGVYANNPQNVGQALGEVFRNEFWGRFDSLWIVGSVQFHSAVVAAVEAMSKSKVGTFFRRPARLPTTASASEPDDAPTATPLSESNLRRWLTSTFRATRSKATTATSVTRSSISSEDWAACSGTYGGSCAASVHEDRAHSPGSKKHGKKLRSKSGPSTCEPMSPSRITAESAFPSAEGSHEGSDAAAAGISPTGPDSALSNNLCPPLPDLQELCDTVFGEGTATKKLVQQPPRSFNDQPGADLVHVTSTPLGSKARVSKASVDSDHRVVLGEEIDPTGIDVEDTSSS